jgi:glycosyltransferase involved in cell wall biosynthesis
MRVLMVTSMFPPYAGGGVSSHVRDLSATLAKRGHDVWILTSRRGKPADVEEQRHVPNGTHVVYCRKFRSMAMTIGRLLRKSPFDIVHFHAFNAVALAPLCLGETPALVFTLHSDSANYLSSVRGWPLHHPSYRAFLWYERMAARLPDVTIAVSKRMEEYGRSIGIRSIVRISNAVDADYWAPPANPPNGRPPTILVPRMHVPKNGIEYATEAMRKIVEATQGTTMLITGDGPLRPILERKAKEVGQDRIRFLGLVSRERMRELYQQVDVVLIPSVTTSRTQENTSIAALEAMASGKPVIATDIGGLPEIIRDGQDGILVPERDSDAVAAAAIRLLARPDLARAIGREARAQVLREFNVSQWADRVVGVYATALDVHGSELHVTGGL